MIIIIWSRSWWWLIHSHKDNDHDVNGSIIITIVIKWLCAMLRISKCNAPQAVSDKTFWWHWANVVLRIRCVPLRVSWCRAAQVAPVTAWDLSILPVACDKWWSSPSYRLMNIILMIDAIMIVIMIMVALIMRMIKRFFHKSITWWNSWSWWSSSTLIMIMIVNIWSRWWWWLINSHKDHYHDHDQMITCDATHFKMRRSARSVEQKVLISWSKRGAPHNQLAGRDWEPHVYPSDFHQAQKLAPYRSKAFWIRWPERILNLMSIQVTFMKLKNLSQPF